MTIEEKAERYDKAFGIARNVWRFSSNNAEIMRMEELFPELRESEGERIRKELIEHIKANCETGFVLFQKFSPDDVIAWLEKQGEQQPVNWSEEDELRINSSIEHLQSTIDKIPKCYIPKEIVADIDWLKSLKDRVILQPETAWSIDDEKVIAIINNALTESNTLPDDYDKVYDWLESLKRRIGG